MLDQPVADESHQGPSGPLRNITAGEGRRPARHGCPRQGTMRRLVNASVSGGRHGRPVLPATMSARSLLSFGTRTVDAWRTHSEELDRGHIEQALS